MIILRRTANSCQIHYKLFESVADKMGVVKVTINATMPNNSTNLSPFVLTL